MLSLNLANARWRKSSYSQGNGACVELACTPNAGLRWHKSTYSGGNGGECVEIANTLGAVRDSKNAAGPALHVDLGAFLAGIKRGQFDL